MVVILLEPCEWLFLLSQSIYLFCTLSVAVNIYLFKVNNRNSRGRCEICSKLIIKISEWCHWCYSGVFVVSIKKILNFCSVFLVHFEDNSVFLVHFVDNSWAAKFDSTQSPYIDQSSHCSSVVFQVSAHIETNSEQKPP